MTAPIRPHAIAMPVQRAVLITNLLPPPFLGHLEIDVDTAHALHAALTRALGAGNSGDILLSDTPDVVEARLKLTTARGELGRAVDHATHRNAQHWTIAARAARAAATHAAAADIFEAAALEKDQANEA